MAGEGGFPDLKASPWPRAQLINTPWYEIRPLLLRFGLQCDRSIEADPNLPVVFLVGPDGTILARDLHGDAIKATLAEVLGLQ